MSLIESLLDAIVRLDGDALVLHVGEKPYVITSSTAMNAFRGPLTWGQVELSTRVLSLDAVTSMLEQLLTPDQRELLGEMGAVEHELPATPDRPAFTVIAARGGDDVWLEVRPVRPKPVAAALETPVDEPVVAVPDTLTAADAAAAGPPEGQSVPAATEWQAPAPVVGSAPEAPVPPAEASVPPTEALPEIEIPLETMAGPEAISIPWAGTEGPSELPTWEPFGAVEPGPLEVAAPEPAAAEPAFAVGLPPSLEVVPEVEQAHPDDHEVSELIAAAGWLETDATELAVETGDHPATLEASTTETAPEPRATETVPEPLAEAIEPAPPVEHVAPVLEAPEPEPVPVDEVPDPFPAYEAIEPEPILETPEPAAVIDTPAQMPAPAMAESVPPSESAAPAQVRSVEERGPDLGAERGPDLEAERGPDLEEVPFQAAESSGDVRSAVVLPLSRTLRDQPSASTDLPSSKPSLDRLLRIAAARGASGLYLVAQSHPVVRVDGEMQPVEGEELLSAGDVEAFTLGLTSEPNREAVRSGATSEWFSDLPELGRVRCFTFSDHRGPGVIVRMLPARAISVEQLGLSRDISGLCEQPDGLVLVAGPRASGKSTLIAAFVELINRSRADHVVTIERQITFVHESRRSFVSQREVRGEADAIATAVRGALREDPDVLVIEELRSADVAAAAIEAAESGRLVLAGLRASAAAPAIERLVEQFPSERRGQILRSLAGTLRGVVAQVLLRKRGGGRIAARELLLNTPAAASVIADGKLFQLGAALESGRKFGNVALNDTLLSLIRDGVVDAGEAWRRSHDRDGLLTLLRREGIDTSFVERLA